MADDEDLVSRLRIEAVDDTGPVLRDIAGKVSETTKLFAELGAGTLIGKAYNDFANYTRTLERLQFSVGATTQQIHGLGKEFEELAKSTGRSADEIARGFNTYLDLSGQSLEPAIAQFRSIADAAKVTGVSMEGLGRAAAAAINDMKVPADQVGELLKKWSVEIPSTMLESFSRMAPRLMQTMDAVGLTGSKNAEEIALAFSEIVKASGNPRAAFTGLNSLLDGMNNASSQPGKILVPVMQESAAGGGDLVAQFKAMYGSLKDLGAFDPGMRPYLQQRFGVDFNTLKTLEAVVGHLNEIKKKMDAGETEAQAFADVLEKMDQDPKSAIDNLKGSVEGLEVSFAGLLQTMGANDLIKKVSDEFNNLKEIVEEIRGKNYGEAAKNIAADFGVGVGRDLPDWAVPPHWSTQDIGGMDDDQPMTAYARRQRRLKKLKPYALGGIVTRPTPALVGEAGPEAIIPLTGGSGGGLASENINATKENTTALNRLSGYMRNKNEQRMALAYTPGAGEVGVPDVAQVYGGSEGGGGGSGPLFRPGIGPRASGGGGSSVGGGGSGYYSGGGNVGGQAPHGVPNYDEKLDAYPELKGTISGHDVNGGEFGRARFAEELKRNPALRQKILRIAANEQGSNPAGTQAVLESMMNRVNMRGTSLAAQAKWHESEGGYYQQGSMGRGALENAKSRSILGESLANALAGANTINYATDNSSQGLAEREAATGKFRRQTKIHGESFFAPGSAERGFARKWDQMMHSESARIGQNHGTADAEHNGGGDGDIWSHTPIPHVLQQHRAMRQEMERPIKMSITPPDTVGRRQRMQSIQSRMASEDHLGAARYASQMDIGFA